MRRAARLASDQPDSPHCLLRYAATRGRRPEFVYPAYERIAVSAQQRDLASNGLCLINVELIYIELL